MRLTRQRTFGSTGQRGLAFCVIAMVVAIPGGPLAAGEAGVAPACSLVQTNGRWHLETPGGQRFFSRGVCVVTQGVPREKFDAQNPGYAAWQHYASTSAWAEATLDRLKAWRLTTLGGWSDFADLQAHPHQDRWLTPVLHLGSTAGAPWWDMWAPTNLARMDSLATERITPFRSDPHRLGYYLDNEMGWWNAALWRMTLEQPPTSGQRQRLLTLLQEVYHRDWQQLLADFDPAGAANWEELERGGMLFVRPGSDGLLTLRRFQSMLATRYYQLMHGLVRRYDPHGLVLGDRYQSFYYPEVARAAGPWVDAISSNLNAHWNDGTWLRCYLDTLHQLTGRPILIGEFYMAATENRSGNRNNSGVFPVVRTQRERAQAIRRSLTHLARTPWVVGADWFQFFDEPGSGREDGENYNFGLVDVHNRPYASVTAAFAAFDPAPFRAGPLPERADARTGVPRAPRDPFQDFAPNTALKHWNRERGFVPPASAFPLADLYVAWSPHALYLGLYAIDVTENAVYRDAQVPEEDRPQWTVEAPGESPITIRLGAGRPATVSDPALRVENLSGLNHDVRNIAILELPCTRLGRPSFRRGDRVWLRARYLSHGRTWRVDWDLPLTLTSRR